VNQSPADAGVVDHIAEPGTSALEKAYALAREMQACGESKQRGFLYITRLLRGYIRIFHQPRLLSLPRKRPSRRVWRRRRSKKDSPMNALATRDCSGRAIGWRGWRHSVRRGDRCSEGNRYPTVGSGCCKSIQNYRTAYQNVWLPNPVQTNFKRPGYHSRQTPDRDRGPPWGRVLYCRVAQIHDHRPPRCDAIREHQTLSNYVQSGTTSASMTQQPCITLREPTYPLVNTGSQRVMPQSGPTCSCPRKPSAVVGLEPTGFIPLLSRYLSQNFREARDVEGYGHQTLDNRTRETASQRNSMGRAEVPPASGNGVPVGVDPREPANG